MGGLRGEEAELWGERLAGVVEADVCAGNAFFVHKDGAGYVSLCRE